MKRNKIVIVSRPVGSLDLVDRKVTATVGENEIYIGYGNADGRAHVSLDVYDSDMTDTFRIVECRFLTLFAAKRAVRSVTGLAEVYPPHREFKLLVELVAKILLINAATYESGMSGYLDFLG